MCRAFPNFHFGSFYHPDSIPKKHKLVLDPQKSEARVLSDAYMINPKLVLIIYGFFVFSSICDLKGKNLSLVGHCLILKALNKL